MTAIACTLTLATAAGHAAPRPDRPPTPIDHRIDQARAKTHACQQQLGLRPAPVSSNPIYGRAYARWVLALWQTRAHAFCRVARELRQPQAAIKAVFGDRAREALAVARCESGYRTDARNGQYLGLFQMGSSERRLYGHGDTALEQARAAHAYFVASGSDWSPWQCRPSGGLAW